jgi:hypothetical protein
MKIEWEFIYTSDFYDYKEADYVSMYRSKVRGGWLINYQRFVDGHIFSDHIIYMPDHHHEWNPLKDETTAPYTTGVALL